MVWLVVGLMVGRGLGLGVLGGGGGVVVWSFSMVAMSRAIAHLWCHRQQLGSWRLLSARSQICLSSWSSLLVVGLVLLVVGVGCLGFWFMVLCVRCR